MFKQTHLLPFVIATLSMLLSACDWTDAPPNVAAVDDKRLVNAAAEPHNWLNHGRTYGEQRFSPLAQINDGNVKQLKLAWHLDLPSKRGLEATPLVADGRMYTTGTWSRVYALDAATGELLWEYDPQVPPQKGIDACCDVVNRGVALWRGMVYRGHPGRQADRAGRHERQGSLVCADHARRPALHHYRRAADRGRQGTHRQRRRRV